MNNLPLVSIAAINFNCAGFVLETLESIRSQTYPNIELVVVDDCSTDDSVAVIDSWLKTYKGQYNFIKHEKNKGVCAACNSGLNNATGKYFSIIATDDLIVTDKIATQVTLLENSDDRIACVYTDAYLINERGQPLPELFIDSHKSFAERPSGNIYDILLQGNFIPGMTFLFKKQVFADLGGYDEELEYEDFDMWLRVARKYQIIFSDFVSCKYRIRQSSLSLTIKNWDYSDIKIFLKHTDAKLPINRLRKLATQAYVTKAKEMMPLIKELAEKILDRYILAVWLVYYFSLPADIGIMILDRVTEWEGATAALPLPEIKSHPIDTFVATILPGVGIKMMNKVVRYLYLNGDKFFLNFMRELALSCNNSQMLCAYIVGKYNIQNDIGDTILQTITDKNGLAFNVKNGSINSEADASFFINDVAPVIPVELLKRIVFDAYCNRNKIEINIVKQLAHNTKDKYIKTVWLLWRYKVNLQAGEIIASRVQTHIQSEASSLFITLGMYKDILEARYKYRAIADLSLERSK
jgi:glycosyltransferase involved in cell wall biosynthesis